MGGQEKFAEEIVGKFEHNEFRFGEINDKLVPVVEHLEKEVLDHSEGLKAVKEVEIKKVWDVLDGYAVSPPWAAGMQQLEQKMAQQIEQGGSVKPEDVMPLVESAVAQKMAALEEKLS